MEAILVKIKILRSTMEYLGFEKGLSDPEVIKLSQKLDNLLNEYYKECLGRPMI